MIAAELFKSLFGAVVQNTSIALAMSPHEGAGILSALISDNSMVSSAEA